MHFIVSGYCYLCIAKKFRDDGTSSLQGTVGACGVRSEQTRDGQWMTGLLPIGPRSNNNKEEHHRWYSTYLIYWLHKRRVKHCNGANTTPATRLTSPSPTAVFFRVASFDCDAMGGHQEGWVM